MTPEAMKQRTKQFALRCMAVVAALPGTPAGAVLGKQLLRSATSVGANYRSACRGRSKAEFIAKAGIALEEADESLYWLELLLESGLMTSTQLDNLMQEANELVAILTATLITAKRNR